MDIIDSVETIVFLYAAENESELHIKEGSQYSTQGHQLILLQFVGWTEWGDVE